MTTHTVTARYEPERGNIPTLTENKHLATIYATPKDAWTACRQLNLDRFHIYAGHPDRDKEARNKNASPHLWRVFLAVGRFIFRHETTDGFHKID